MVRKNEKKSQIDDSIARILCLFFYEGMLYTVDSALVCKSDDGEVTSLIDMKELCAISIEFFFQSISNNNGNIFFKQALLLCK